MTLTLESALADLPAKPRVHELSKRVGTTSKEMIAVLNERGLTVSSASASVPRAVAVAVIEQYLGVPAPIEPDESPTEAPTGSSTAGDSAVEVPAQERPPVGPTPVERPVADDPGARRPAAGDPLAPLFLPPSETVAVPPEARPAEDRGRAGEDEGAEEAPPKRSRRRRGRPAGRRSEPDESAETGEASTPEPEAEEAEAPADEGPE